ncbi:uncharacterized protein LOC144743273 [Ciona intestinalis]
MRIIIIFAKMASRALDFRNITSRIKFNREELLLTTLAGQLVTVFTIFDVCMIFVISLFIAWVKDKKLDCERQPVFMPIRPPGGFRLYAVILETGESPAGGTSARVFLRILGKYTSSPAFSLMCVSSQRTERGRKLFGSQNKDIFILSLPHYLGGIESFEVLTDRKGDSPPWFLRSIRVMCLDNHKCWKSRVGAWLRGDMKPYKLRAHIIGALSTREYLTKVFLQNYAWAFTWYRPLGSSFSCVQRCLIHWASVGSALGISHYFLYDIAIIENVRSGVITTPAYTANEVAQSAVIAALGGATFGFFLRVLVRGAAGGNKWARVDDKDDFSHLMGEGDLEYATGAVVQIPTTAFDDCLVSLKLTKQQIRAIKHITQCGVSECSLKARLDNPVCSSNVDCCYSKPPEEIEEEEEVQVEELNLAGTSWQDPADAAMEFNDKLMADRRGYKDDVVEEMNELHPEQNTAKSKPETKKMRDVVNRLWGMKILPSESKESERNLAPTVSARVVSSSDDTASEVEIEVIKSSASKSSGASKKSEGYDSLSEEESDEEIVTKSARTDSEINLTRRAENVYKIAPQWNDRKFVWVQAAEGGNEHHTIVHQRYDFADAGDCCLRRDEGLTLEAAINHYKGEEDQAPLGRVVEPDGSLANGVALLGALVGIAGVAYTINQRLLLPNADTLLYLYSVLFLLFLHPVVFTLVDGVFCALAASWARRRRILKSRRDNARRLREEVYAESVSSVAQ